MKGITLYQPWASWIAMGWKTIETRTRNHLASLAGQRIAIHAGKTFNHGACGIARPYMTVERCAEAELMVYPSGVVVCTAMVKEARKLNGKDSPRAMYRCGDCDTYGLILTDIKPVDPPVEATGHRGIWEWEPPEPVVGPAPQCGRKQKGPTMAKTAKTAKTANKTGGRGKDPLLAGDDLNRIYGEHDVVDERAETLLDAQVVLKQAKDDYAEAFDRLDKLLIDSDADRGAEVVHARADLRDRGKLAGKAAEAVKVAKAGLEAAWGVIYNLIDEKIDGLPLLDQADEAAQSGRE